MIWYKDDGLPEDLFKQVLQTVKNQPLVFGWPSNPEIPFGHWNHTYGGRARKNRTTVNDDLPPAISKAWDYISKHYMPDHKHLVRSYINGHTYGNDGYLHRDSDVATDMTCVVYCVEEWTAEWAGETVILDENEEIEKAILPKPNRLAFFEANRLHAGRAVSRMCPMVRTVLVFKAKADNAADGFSD